MVTIERGDAKEIMEREDELQGKEERKTLEKRHRLRWQPIL